MPRLSLWNSGRKSANYRFIDHKISQFFGAGGTTVFAHLYRGPYQQDYPVLDLDGDPTPPFDPETSPPVPQPGVRGIQDVLFLENRDRQYAKVVYEMRGIYNVTDADFDLRQFGLFLQNDTLFLEFHYNDMIALLGRRLMPGDVLELPHQRDLDLLNGGPAINKFYAISDANKASDGYSATWWPHIWRVKAAPMPASQEYQDILDQQATNPLGLDIGMISTLMSTLGTEMAIDTAIVDQAIATVPQRNFQTQHYWIVPSAQAAGENPWIYAGDGVPPNGAVLAGSGSSFPTSPTTSDYYLRTDYHPAGLFQWDGHRWLLQEIDWRGTTWSAADRLLYAFINNAASARFGDGTTAPARVDLSQAVLPRADF